MGKRLEGVRPRRVASIGQAWVLTAVRDEGWDREIDEKQRGDSLVEHGRREVGLRGSGGRIGFGGSPVARRSCPSRAWRVLLCGVGVHVGSSLAPAIGSGETPSWLRAHDQLPGSLPRPSTSECITANAAGPARPRSRHPRSANERDQHGARLVARGHGSSLALNCRLSGRTSHLLRLDTPCPATCRCPLACVHPTRFSRRTAPLGGNSVHSASRATAKWCRS